MRLVPIPLPMDIFANAVKRFQKPHQTVAKMPGTASVAYVFIKAARCFIIDTDYFHAKEPIG